MGVETENIASALRIMVGGDDRASRFYDASVNDSYDVQLRLIDADRSDVGAISRLYVPSSRGYLAPRVLEA